MIKKKVAILSLVPFTSMGPDSAQHWTDIAEVICNTFKVRFFCLSNKNSRYLKFKGFGVMEIEGKSPSWNAKEIAALIITGKRPSIISDYPDLGRELFRYNPDFIITGEIALYYFLRSYIRKNTRVKVVLVTDTPEGIETYNVDMLDYMGYGFLKPFVRRNYIKFHLGLYKQMLRLCYRIVTPSDYHKKKMQKRYPKFAAKIFGINPHFIRILPKQRYKKSIRRILFIGDFGNVSNREAVEQIKKIAVAMPNKSFIVAGRGAPRKHEGNIFYMGEVSEREKEDLYRRADLCIAPMLTSSGKKSKVFDYFIHNKVVIGTTRAFDGFGGVISDKNVIIEDDLEQYPNRINSLEDNTTKFLNIQRSIYTLIKDYTKEKIKNRWSSVLR